MLKTGETKETPRSSAGCRAAFFGAAGGLVLSSVAAPLLKAMMESATEYQLPWSSVLLIIGCATAFSGTTCAVVSCATSDSDQEAEADRPLLNP